MKIIKFAGAALRSKELLAKVVTVLRIALRNELVAGGASDKDTGACNLGIGKCCGVVVVASAGRSITDELLNIAHRAAQGDESYEHVVNSYIRENYALLANLPEIAADCSEPETLKVDVVALHARTQESMDALTAELLDILRAIFLVGESSAKLFDLVASFGERFAALLAAYFLEISLAPAVALDSRKFIITDDTFGNANVNLTETFERVRALFDLQHQCLTENSYDNPTAIPVVTGFIASAATGETTTLGRGGADYTASLLAAALDAKEIQLWTVVNGVMTADPRRVSKALPISYLSFREAAELSHLGAQILYPPTLQPACDYGIPIRVLNLQNIEFPGTLISNAAPQGFTRQLPITGISSLDRITLLRLEGTGLIGRAGISQRIFQALASSGVNVILITQDASEHSICIAIQPKDEIKAEKSLSQEFASEIALHKIDAIEVERDLSVIAVVGENMRRTAGVAAKLFQALSQNGINAVAIAQGSSERNLSVVISRHSQDKALRAVHDAFFLSTTKSIHLFLVGTGQVGGTLLEQIAANRDFLKRKHALDIKVIALADSKQMLFVPEGFGADELSHGWEKALAESQTPTDLGKFIEEMRRLNLPNCIFVDCTASEDVALLYKDILSHAFSIVTPNKKANSNTLVNYHELKEVAKKANVKFFYETNVGAGLPVIGTLNDLILSGDEIIRIEAVLSGTLSYIFNTFKPPMTFSEVVRNAQLKGYTEPDPRDDLSGLDVARKVLILARESGIPLEMQDIKVESLIPPGGERASSVEEFYSVLQQHDGYYSEKLAAAEMTGGALRYTGLLEAGPLETWRAEVSLRMVSSEHPFFSLSGSDNIISFTTARYRERPLVVKGPGAGTAVTAAGIFADIVRVASYLL